MRHSVDNCLYSSYILKNLAPLKDASRVTPVGGARAVPAGGGSSPPFPGGSGLIRPAGTMTGLRGNPLHWDGRERVTPVPNEVRLRKRVNGGGAGASGRRRKRRGGTPEGEPPPCLPRHAGGSEGAPHPSMRRLD